MRWGLLPSWVKDPKTFALLINARGESVVDKPAFRAAMKRRRCLIPADGFYEWKAVAGRKQPYYVRAKSGAPFAFAGLWETWTGPNGEELETAAIVTTAANRTLAAIHDRMPVIVPPDAFDLWLDCKNVEAETAAALMTPPYRLVLSLVKDREALTLIAHDVREFRPDTPGVTGPVPVSLQFAEIWQTLTGKAFRQSMAERIYKLEKVRPS